MSISDERTLSYLSDTQPLLGPGSVIGETKDDLGRLLGVEGEALEPIRLAAGRDLAVEGAVDDHVQRPNVLVPLVERDADLDDVLGVFKVVLDPTAPDAGDEEALTRPARVGAAIAVPSVFGEATVRAAAIPGRPLVVCGGLGHHRRPASRIGEGWDRSHGQGGVRGGREGVVREGKRVGGGGLGLHEGNKAGRRV